MNLKTVLCAIFFIDLILPSKAQIFKIIEKATQRRIEKTFENHSEREVLRLDWTINSEFAI